MGLNVGAYRKLTTAEVKRLQSIAEKETQGQGSNEMLDSLSEFLICSQANCSRKVVSPWTRPSETDTILFFCQKIRTNGKVYAIDFLEKAIAQTRKI
jgi:hypothetical protein